MFVNPNAYGGIDFMDISILEVLGPGDDRPLQLSYSRSGQTWGGQRSDRGKSFSKVEFGLHGSFAHTYKGHGTDMALLGGVLGLREDDERLRDAIRLPRNGDSSIGFMKKSWKMSMKILY